MCIRDRAAGPGAYHAPALLCKDLASERFQGVLQLAQRKGLRREGLRDGDAGGRHAGADRRMMMDSGQNVIAFFDLDHTLLDGSNGSLYARAMVRQGYMKAVSYTHLTLPTIYSV